MKEIRDKREETIVKYQAEDGTVFNNKAECIKYDNTALCVVRSRLKINTISGWDLAFGDDDHTVEIIKGKPEDVKMYAVFRRSGWEPFDNNVEEFIKKDLKENDVTLLFLHCNDDPYKIVTFDDFIENIKNCCKDAE